jgi:hypothetical protein
MQTGIIAPILKQSFSTRTIARVASRLQKAKLRSNKKKSKIKKSFEAQLPDNFLEFAFDDMF